MAEQPEPPTLQPNGNIVYKAGPLSNENDGWITVPAYGFLDGLELRFMRPIPNMDAMYPLRFYFAGLGEATPPFSVIYRYQAAGEKPQ